MRMKSSGESSARMPTTRAATIRALLFFAIGMAAPIYRESVAGVADAVVSLHPDRANDAQRMR
jgi:hypothetical protein